MFKTYFLDVIKNHYVDFRGRATRKQFWLFMLFNLIIGIIFAILGSINNSIGTLFNVLALIYDLAMLLPYLAISVRRLHDINLSGWWLLLSFIPGGLLGMLQVISNSPVLQIIASSFVIICGLILLVFYVLPSKEPNRF